MMLVRSLETGMNIFAVAPSSDPFRGLPKDSRIDFVAMVPYQLQVAMSSPQGIERLNRINTVLVGGATIAAAWQHAIQQLTCRVFSTYGMTETLSHIALQRLNGTNL